MKAIPTVQEIQDLFPVRQRRNRAARGGGEHSDRVGEAASPVGRICLVVTCIPLLSRLGKGYALPETQRLFDHLLAGNSPAQRQSGRAQRAGDPGIAVVE